MTSRVLVIRAEEDEDHTVTVWVDESKGVTTAMIYHAEETLDGLFHAVQRGVMKEGN